MTTDKAPERDAITAIEASETRQHFTDVRHVTVRWEPYKPDGRRQMKAKGRWQEQVGSGDYWRWQNCDRPAFAHDPAPSPDVLALVEALTVERDYWAKKASADLAEQDLYERLLDYPTERKMTEAMGKADALNAALARITDTGGRKDG